jgi:uncharacterized membrane protein
LQTTQEVRQSVALRVAAAAICAALYGIFGYATSNIASPFGFGQFRPAVVIPAVFAVLFGPWVGGVGAAIGSQITDTLTPHYFISGLVAGVPANFFGFWLFGRMTYPTFSWRRYVYASLSTLTSANLIAGFLVAAYLEVITRANLSLGGGIVLGSGLASWWFITMLPFVLTLGPLAIRSVARARPGFITLDVSNATLSKDLPSKTFSFALILPAAVILAFTGLLFAMPNVPELLSSSVSSPGAVVPPSAFEVMYGVGGGVMLLVGLATLAASKVIYGQRKVGQLH